MEVVDWGLLTVGEAATVCGCDTTNYPDEVRVVTMSGFPCPCGGTHVVDTAGACQCVVWLEASSGGVLGGCWHVW